MSKAKGKGAAVDALEEGAVVDALAAVDHLDALEQEEVAAAGTDEAIAEEVAGAEEKKLTAAQDKAARQRAAEAGAAMAVGFVESILKAQAPYLVVPDGSRENLVNTLAPVLAKHGGGMPSWLVPYQEEFRFAVAAGGFAFGMYLQVQAHKQAELARQQKEAEDERAEA